MRALLALALLASGCAAPSPTAPSATPAEEPPPALVVEVEFWINCMPPTAGTPNRAYPWVGFLRIQSGNASAPFPADLEAMSVTFRGRGWEASQALYNEERSAGNASRAYWVDAPEQVPWGRCADTERPTGIQAVVTLLRGGRGAGILVDEDVRFGAAH